MSNIYNHRPMVPTGQGATSRISELIDGIKAEVEQLQQEATLYKVQRDDLEHKVQQQTEEVSLIRQHLYELQATQSNIKKQYDQELLRLQRELDQLRMHPHPSSSGHPQQSSHPQPPPPNIGQGQSNLFSTIMSPSGLAPPPAMSLDPTQQPAGQPSHTYPGPGGPSQNAPPSNSSSSPYMNGGGPQGGPLSQNHQHATKRPRIEDGVPSGPQPSMGIATGPQPPPTANLYPGNPLPPAPPNQPGQPLLGQQYIQGVNTANKTGKMPKPGNPPSQVPPNMATDTQPPMPTNGGGLTNVGPANKRMKPTLNPQQPSAPRPQTSKPSSVSTSSTMNDMDLDNVPQSCKKEGPDWFAIFNPKVQRQLDVDLLHTLDHSSVVCCVKFSMDGKYLATGCNRSAQIFDVVTGNRISTLVDSNVDKGGDLYIRSVCFSPDGRYLATGAEDKQIRIWDIHSSEIRNVFTGHEQDIYSLDFSRDGRLIVSGSGDKTARLWDMSTREMVYKLPVDESSQKDAGVTSVAISQDGSYVAAGSLDKIVRVWDTRTGYLLERLEGHKDSVYSVAFSPDGKTLVSGSLDKTLKLWDMSNLGQTRNGTNSKCLKMTFNGHKDFVLSVAVSPDARWVVSGSKDRGVQFWDPNTSNTQFMLQGHKNSVISVALSQTNKLFATGSGDLRARIWRYTELMS